MKKELIIAIVIGVLVIGLGLFIYLWVQAKNELQIRDTIIHQNELAFNDTLKIIKNENGTLYKKLAYVENINQKIKNDSTALALLTKEQKEKILSLVIAMAELVKFRDSVMAVQDFEVPPSLVGRQLFFSDDSTRQSFFHYKEIVTLGNKSTNDMTITGTPFSIAVATARDIEGIMSGIIEFNPKWINDYLEVSDVSVSMDTDEYIKYIETKPIFSLSLFPSVGIMIMPEMYFLYGGGVMLNKKHMVEYQTVLGKSIHIIKYSYNIPLW